MIAVAMDAWRVNEQGEPLEELEGGERESGGTVRCGMFYPPLRPPMREATPLYRRR